MSKIKLDEIKEHYHFEQARKSEINANLKGNIQLSLASISFLYFIGTSRDIPINCIFSILYWLSFSLSCLSIIVSGWASIGYGTRYPDTPDVSEKYYAKLKVHDEANADTHFTKYINDRWIENASENAKRNRKRSELNYGARLLLAIAAIPLASILILSVKVRFPL